MLQSRLQRIENRYCNGTLLAVATMADLAVSDLPANGLKIISLLMDYMMQEGRGAKSVARLHKNALERMVDHRGGWKNIWHDRPIHSELFRWLHRFVTFG